MKIFNYYQDNFSSTYYRCVLPHRHLAKPLAEAGIELSFGKEVSRDDYYDYYIFHRVPSERSWPLIDHFMDRGSQLIWDLDDDFWSLPDWNPFAKEFDVNTIMWINYAIRKSAYVITTTEHLAQRSQECMPWDNPRVTLPNLIDLNDYTDPDFDKFDNPKYIRCIWGGSPTHKKDLMEFINIINPKVSYDDKVKFVFVGHQVPERFFIPYVMLEDYSRLLYFLNCHISLMPLSDHLFNKSKSNIKYMEMSMMGSVSVTNMVENVYSETCPLVQRIPDEPLRFKSICQHPNFLKKLAIESYEDVRDRLSWKSESAKSKWLDFFLGLPRP